MTTVEEQRAFELHFHSEDGCPAMGAALAAQRPRSEGGGFRARQLPSRSRSHKLRREREGLQGRLQRVHGMYQSHSTTTMHNYYYGCCVPLKPSTTLRPIRLLARWRAMSSASSSRCLRRRVFRSNNYQHGLQETENYKDTTRILQGSHRAAVAPGQRRGAGELVPGGGDSKRRGGRGRDPTTNGETGNEHRHEAGEHDAMRVKKVDRSRGGLHDALAEQGGQPGGEWQVHVRRALDGGPVEEVSVDVEGACTSADLHPHAVQPDWTATCKACSPIVAPFSITRTASRFCHGSGGAHVRSSSARATRGSFLRDGGRWTRATTCTACCSNGSCTKKDQDIYWAHLRTCGHRCTRDTHFPLRQWRFVQT